MSPETVRELIAKLVEVERILSSHGKASETLDVRDSNLVTVFIACGTCYERKLTDGLIALCDSQCPPSISHFVRVKALKRQYHTMFNWEDENLGSFKTLFGDKFTAFIKDYMSDVSTRKNVDAFLWIGSRRNEAAHTFKCDSPNKTLEDILVSFEDGLQFLDDSMAQLVRMGSPHNRQCDDEHLPESL